MSVELIFNWKMNPLSKSEAKGLFLALENGLKNKPEAKIAICPPFVYLDFLNGLRKERGVQFGFGVQDLSVEEKGALTGQISGNMLNDFGVDCAILGHSETRLFCNLTDEKINKKVCRALENNISPILCIGFESSPGGGEINYDELKKQIVTGLGGVNSNIKENIYIAYEPVWAIGSGEAATPEIVEKVTKFIQEVLKEIGSDLQKKVKILYGGSVTDKNMQELASINGVSGFLIGGASLVPEKIIKMIEKT